MSKILNFLKKQQTGFSLVELLIAMVIVAVLGVAISMTFSQIVGSNSGVTNRQFAIKQVQYVVDAISRDAQQASTIVWASPNLTFTIPIPVTNGSSISTQNTTVQYTYANNTLQRVSGSNTTTVATDITSFIPPSSYSTGVYTLTVTATAPLPPKTGGAVETRVLQIIPRSQN